MEWLETGPPAREPRQRRLVVGAVLAAVVVAAVVVTGTDRGAAEDPKPSAPASSSPTSRPPAVPTAAPTEPTRSPTSTRGFLRDLDLDLYVRGVDAVYRLQTRSGRITQTPWSGDLQDPTVMLVSGERVLILGYPGGGVGLEPGSPPKPLRGALAEASTALPGPAGRVWVPDDEDSFERMRLVSLDGTPTDTVVDAGGDYLRSDGRGGLLAVGVGGTYAARPGELRRISRGAVVAVGPDHLLLSDCSASHRCQNYVYDVERGDLRPSGIDYDSMNSGGIVSPGGRWAVLQSWGRNGQPLARVVEVASGRIVQRLPPRADGSDDPLEGTVWLPGDRLLGVHGGRLYVLDLRTGRIEQPQLGLPPLRQLAERVPG